MNRLFLVLLLLSLVTGAAAEIGPITITTPSDGELCGEAWLCAEGTVLFSENHRVVVFWKGQDGLWYVGDNPVPTDGDVWTSCIIADPDNIVGISANFMYLIDALEIDCGKGYTQEELSAITLYSVEVNCCSEVVILNIISPVDGEDVGIDSTNIPIEGSHNLDDPEVTLWLAGYTENNSNVWPLGTVDKNSDGTFSGIANIGSCPATCNATDIKIIVFALRPSGVEIWEGTAYMTPDEFDEFLETMSCVDDAVCVNRPCEPEPTPTPIPPVPVPTLSLPGILALAEVLGLIGAARIKRR